MVELSGERGSGVDDGHVSFGEGRPDLGITPVVAQRGVGALRRVEVGARSERDVDIRIWRLCELDQQSSEAPPAGPRRPGILASHRSWGRRRGAPCQRRRGLEAPWLLILFAPLRSSSWSPVSKSSAGRRGAPWRCPSPPEPWPTGTSYATRRVENRATSVSYFDQAYEVVVLLLSCFQSVCSLDV